MSPLALLLIATVAAATATDLRSRRVPDALTAPAALAALALGLALDPGGGLARVAAGLGAAGFFLAAALGRPGAMGLGDAKLAGVMGLCLGPGVAVAVAVALAAGATAGAALAVRHGLAVARASTIPFAPCLALGALVAAAGAG